MKEVNRKYKMKDIKINKVIIRREKCNILIRIYVYIIY